MVEFFDSSPKLIARGRGQRLDEVEYPFDGLEVGKSFHVKANAIKIGSLRNKASTMGKKLGRKFSVLDHGEAGYEVGRIK